MVTGLAVPALADPEPAALELTDPELVAVAEPDELVRGAALVFVVLALTLAVLCLASAGS